MRTTSSWLALGILAAFAALALAQSQDKNKRAPDKPPAEEEEQKGEFPKPLQYATSNLRDLQRTGFLSVVSVEDRTIDNRGNTGFVWTIKPTKTITFRHVQMILRQVRQVQFFVRQETTLKEVHSALLHHSPRIDSGASSGMVFTRDEQFEVWFYLDEAIRRRLAKRHVDLVVFRRLKR